MLFNFKLDLNMYFLLAVSTNEEIATKEGGDIADVRTVC